MIKKLKKNILIFIGLTGIIYLIFTIYADVDSIVFSFSIFNWWLLPLILCLTFSNYLVRFLKWHYYVKLLRIDITFLDSFSVFMSGLIMSVTPGKMGELLKSYMLKKINNTPISVSAPIIAAERITDFTSLILIAVIGAYSFNYGKEIIVIVGLFFFSLPILLSSERATNKSLNLLSKISFLHKIINQIENSYRSASKLLRLKDTFLMTILSLFSWFFECIGYYLILKNFQIEVSILWASFSYTFSTIIGAISMLPGGLGLTEGSLTFLLMQMNVDSGKAVASTFLIRAATLWFAVIVGIVSVILYQKRFGILQEELNQNEIKIIT